MRWLLVLLALSGPAHACDAGDTEMVEAQLLFGRGSVSAADWADFLARSVTPRFPDGLTALDGQGQWLNPKNATISHEPSTVLLLLTPTSPDLRTRLDAVRDDYRQRFHQQSVGLVTASVCAAF
jgi:hypothetical protein